MYILTDNAGVVHTYATIEKLKYYIVDQLLTLAPYHSEWKGNMSVVTASDYVGDSIASITGTTSEFMDMCNQAFTLLYQHGVGLLEVDTFVLIRVSLLCMVKGHSQPLGDTLTISITKRNPVVINEP